MPQFAIPHVCLSCGAEYPSRPTWCWHCLTTGFFAPAGRRPASAIEQEPQITTARELAASAWSLVSAGAYPIRLLRGAMIVVYGSPGAGKSTLAMKMAASMRGPVVMLAAEERLNASLGERLQRLSIRRDDFVVIGRASVDQVADTARRVKARALLIDSVSVTPLQPHDVRHLLQRLGLECLIAVQQVRKDGEAAGSNAWLHEADVVVRVSDGRWRVEKSRYGQPGQEADV